MIVSIAVNWRKQSNALIELNLGAAEGIGKRAAEEEKLWVMLFGTAKGRRADD